MGGCLLAPRCRRTARDAYCPGRWHSRWRCAWGIRPEPVPPVLSRVPVGRPHRPRHGAVHMAGDQITAYVLFNLHGKDLSLTLEGRLSVQDGYLRLAATRLMLGSLPIPQATVDRAVGSLFDSPENRERFRLPPDIRGLKVENSELVITWR